MGNATGYWRVHWTPGLIGPTLGPSHVIVSLDKTLSSHSVSLYPVTKMDPGKFLGKPDEMLGGNLALDRHPIQGKVVILLVTSCCGN